MGCRNDPRLTEEDVDRSLPGAEVANYKLPKEVRFVDGEADLPRSTTGKIKRHELEMVLDPFRLPDLDYGAAAKPDLRGHAGAVHAASMLSFSSGSAVH